ncbi:hypothetical protein Zm00014a_009334 [Zea mays]|uniref:Myb/SANT-like domain-containing protein n=1 Tax=Zea mays TaxID=4577 RepID=A0A3L6EH46_MAIZE|nr:hypothetical protein Zm00014a_009334 [Zea mays]PWZ18548.1 hypothetical protein Zm00014a_009334 [Zea mays]
MAGKGSPRFNMSSSPKLRRFIPTTSATKKGLLLNAVGQKRVVVLQEVLCSMFLHVFSGYRGDNGWNSEGWNRMVKEFHVRNKYVSFTKAQIQDKEGHLAEGTWSCTSLEAPQDEELNEQLQDAEDGLQGF